MTLGRDRKNAETAKPHWIEWVTGVVSLLLVSGLIGWIAMDLLRAKDGAPDLTAGVTEIDKVTAGWLVRFEVANLAAQTAAEVQIEAALALDGETVDEASATIDYVPGHSKARGGLIFSRNPDGLELQLKAVGYRQP